MSDSIYTHSGKLGMAPIVWPVIFIPCAVVLSAAYAYLDVYIPLGGYVSFILLAGYVFGLGIVSAFAVKVAKCRSTTAAGFLGFLGGLFALYASWLIFLYALINKFDEEGIGLVPLLIHPGAMWQTILLINKEGWFSIRGSTPTGAVLGTFWVIEAVAILGGMIFLSGMRIRHEIFCETCSRWLPVFEKRMYKPPTETHAGNFNEVEPAALLRLEEMQESNFPAVRCEFLVCNTCGAKGLRYKYVELVTDKEGKTSEKSTNYKHLLKAPA
ncbi:MAG: hypothetical protein JXB10_19165 [Pirellulales bacterium]|nr:hypothetical protein [Pirellulales bacterium]